LIEIARIVSSAVSPDSVIASVAPSAAIDGSLLAAASSAQWLLVILQVAIGLGMVIFVHELGHFAVAKMCGVKCEKFFIGFDIGGYKISRQWGETEYGIGILPLGGYVKMLGQDDNPANIAEQVRLSQVENGEPVEGEGKAEEGGDGQTVSNAEHSANGREPLETTEIVGPGGERFVVDSRSYLAKSVPQRMAIISAGVIMNVIFAALFATVAYRLGVPYTPCVVSQTAPGAPAWQAGIRTGDEVVQVNGMDNPSFAELMSGVTLGDLENGVPFVIRRAETGENETILLTPHQGKGLAKVGIYGPLSLRLDKELPAGPGTPAAQTDSPFQGGDQIIPVDGQAVKDFRQLTAQLVRHPSKRLEITVRRGGKPPADNPFGPLAGGEKVTIALGPWPLKRLGVVMEIGQITSVQQGSPAAEAGIQAGDFIDQIDQRKIGGLPTEDQPNWDPVTLPEHLLRLADQGHRVQLTIRRAAASSEGPQRTETLEAALRPVDWTETARAPGDPIAAPALGIAYQVLNRIDTILPDSPAQRAGLRGGDTITKIEFIPSQENAEASPAEPSEPFLLGQEDQHNWPAFFHAMQWMESGDKLKLTCQRGEETFEVELKPVPVPDDFLSERGFHFQAIRRLRMGRTLGEQVRMGMRETTNSLGMVFHFLRKLGTQVPLTSLGGPVTIAKAAGYSAFEGAGKLLLFLTMLSANLAVINFLPIPLLDGGHMVFLAWEGLRGRPASERFVVALHTIGFVFIITLMLFVLALDLNIIPRNL